MPLRAVRLCLEVPDAATHPFGIKERAIFLAVRKAERPVYIGRLTSKPSETACAAERGISGRRRPGNVPRGAGIAIRELYGLQ